MNWASYLESTDEISTLLPLITSSDVSTLTEETLVSKQVHEVHQVLLAVSPNYLQLIDIAVARLNILPPAGAMAGVYASLDGSQGVWKAPANVKLNAVKAPVIVLNDQEQEMLVNVTRGKYINSIRSFTGQGVLVWGARTIEGNDHEFKYICVRRTAIMIEQSIRKALQLYAIKPNDSNTWGVVKGMIQNFLNALWRQGAFRGIKQEEAFFVTIGLGSTMTEEDILQGLMVIKIGVAFVRPAEFTYIKIVRQMQKME
jgi:phage tail sheath protein FI